MRAIHWGFIGCGAVAERSGPAFREVAGSDVVAVMSRTAEHARAYAERHGIATWYTDAQALIDDPRVNAVYVATPPASHATYTIMALRAGKPVYVEKPLAASYDDCARVNHVVHDTGVPCFVAYYRHYLPYFQKVHELVGQGRIGRLQNVLIRYASPPRAADLAADGRLPWRVMPEIAGGGYFYDLAPIQLELLQQLFGVITHAEGFCANRGGHYKAEDSVSASFMFENGVPGSGSWIFSAGPTSFEDRMELIGDQGTVCFSVFTHEPLRLHTAEGVREYDIAHPPLVQLPLIRSVVETLQGVANCQCTALAATPANWVVDRILGKF